MFDAAEGVKNSGLAQRATEDTRARPPTSRRRRGAERVDVRIASPRSRDVGVHSIRSDVGEARDEDS